MMSLLPSSSSLSFLLLLLFCSCLVMGQEGSQVLTFTIGEDNPLSFVVPTYNEGHVNVTLSTFSSQQIEDINSIDLCITWQIPQQDSLCDHVLVAFPTNENEPLEMPVNFGINYFQATINYKKPGLNMPVNMTLEILGCDDNYGGDKCETQVLTTNLDEEITITGVDESGPVFVMIPTNPGYSSYTYAASFLLSIKPNNGADFEIQPAISSFNPNAYSLPKVSGNSDLTQTYNAPPFSRSSHIIYPQYWIIMVRTGQNITLKGSIEYCSKNGYISDSGSPCTIPAIDLQTTVGVPTKYSSTGSLYFELPDPNSLHIASQNAEMTLGIDNPPQIIQIGQKATYYNISFEDSFRSIVLEITAQNASEPIYIWGTNSTVSCPLNCNGYCTPGEYLCYCDDGSVSISCPTNPKDGGPVFLIVIGVIAGLVVVAGLVIGFLVWRKRSQLYSEI